VNKVRFEERQYFRQRWLWLTVGLVVAAVWWGFIQQIARGTPFGGNPGPDWLVWLLWLAVGIGLPLLFWRAHLRVSLTEQELTIRYVPFTVRHIPLVEVTGARAREYGAIREYGGWGIRGSRDKRAYNVSGNEGVEVSLKDGRTVMIGSQRAQELERAIRAINGRARRPLTRDRSETA